MRSVGRCLIVVTLMIGALSPSSALAHNNCGGDANGPFRADNGTKVRGKISYLCESVHNRYILNGCLQKRNDQGDWVNRDCVSYDSGSGSFTGASAFVQVSCTTGSFRTVFTYGALQSGR